MDDIMKQNPELMQQFTQAAVNQMEQLGPGFGGSMNTLNEEDEVVAAQDLLHLLKLKI